MKLRSLLAKLSVVACFAIVAILLTPNGYWEMRNLKSQMQKTSQHIRQIEVANQELRRRVDLFRNEDLSALQYRWREELLMIKEGEILYWEAKGPSSTSKDAQSSPQ